MANVVKEGDRFGQGSLMVWGGISIGGCADLVVVRGNLTAVGNIKQILLNMCWLLHTVLALNSYSCTTMSGLK
jgi:hypothetical protein